MHHVFQQNGGAVECELDDVFAGVGAGGREEGDEGFIEGLAVVIEEVAETGAGVLQGMFEADQLSGDGGGEGAAEAYDADAAAAGCGGDCGDGLRYRHGLRVAETHCSSR